MKLTLNEKLEIFVILGAQLVVLLANTFKSLVFKTPFHKTYDIFSNGVWIAVVVFMALGFGYFLRLMPLMRKRWQFRLKTGRSFFEPDAIPFDWTKALGYGCALPAAIFGLAMIAWFRGALELCFSCLSYVMLTGFSISAVAFSLFVGEFVMLKIFIWTEQRKNK